MHTPSQLYDFTFEKEQSIAELHTLYICDDPMFAKEAGILSLVLTENQSVDESALC